VQLNPSLVLRAVVNNYLKPSTLRRIMRRSHDRRQRASAQSWCSRLRHRQRYWVWYAGPACSRSRGGAAGWLLSGGQMPREHARYRSIAAAH